MALFGPWWVVTHVAAPPSHGPGAPFARPTHIAGAEAPPEVEPVALQDLTPEEARAANAAIPFDRGPLSPARPFRFEGAPAALARATDCLAAGVIYEAGDDPVGERAVAQVVLNRLRHPAFPKTVCGVVFQGEERSTGCQFTFACDGAMTRWRPTDAAWERARAIARAALSGTVFRPVGYATHYHTDWLVPYWRDSLDKIAAVGTHLFYRWTGWWGTPGAFRRTVSFDDAPVAKLAALSEAHRTGAAFGEAVEALAAATPLIDQAAATAPATAGGAGDTFAAALNAALPDAYAAQALATCGIRPRCKFMGWTDRRLMPASADAPLEPAQVAAMSFSYFRDRDSGLERTLWNCTQFSGRDPHRCMKRQTMTVAAPAPAASPTPGQPVVERGPAALSGVRRKPAPAATVAPPPVADQLTPTRTSPAARP